MMSYFSSVILINFQVDSNNEFYWLAFLLQPRLIVLDEPTTALDVTTQTLVLNIIRKLCREYNVAAIYVSHDLTVVKDIADRVIVLYSGRIAEDAVLTQLFETLNTLIRKVYLTPFPM